MAKNTKTRTIKKRLKIKNLPAAEKELDGKDMKKVKGGEFVLSGAATIGSSLPGTIGMSGSASNVSATKTGGGSK